MKRITKSVGEAMRTLHILTMLASTSRSHLKVSSGDILLVLPLVSVFSLLIIMENALLILAPGPGFLRTPSYLFLALGRDWEWPAWCLRGTSVSLQLKPPCVNWGTN